MAEIGIIKASDYQKEEWICQVPEDITAVPEAEVRAVPGVARVWEVPVEVPEAPVLEVPAPEVFTDPVPLWATWGIGPLRHPSRVSVAEGRHAGVVAAVSCR